MTLRKTVLAVMIVALASGAARSGTIEELNQASAGNDMEELRRQVDEFARLANAEIDAKGVEAATTVFRTPQWRRNANGLHIWGVTTTGVDWFNAAYPEFEQLVISEMS